MHLPSITCGCTHGGGGGLGGGGGGAGGGEGGAFFPQSFTVTRTSLDCRLIGCWLELMGVSEAWVFTCKGQQKNNNIVKVKSNYVEYQMILHHHIPLSDDNCF